MPASFKPESWSQGPERAEGRGTIGGAYSLTSPGLEPWTQRNHEKPMGSDGCSPGKDALPAEQLWGSSWKSKVALVVAVLVQEQERIDRVWAWPKVPVHGMWGIQGQDVLNCNDCLDCVWDMEYL